MLKIVSGLYLLNLHVSGVGQNIKNILKVQDSVKDQHVVNSTFVGQKEVYSLSTNAGVYYANKILVKNCDAMSFSLEYMKKTALPVSMRAVVPKIVGYYE